MTPTGSAFAQQGAGPTASAPAAATAEIKLSPITVIGRMASVPAPVALQMVKNALHRPVNYRHENLNKLYCQVDGFPARLDCHTNCQLWIQSESLAGVHVSNQLCASGYRSSAYVGTPGWRAVALANWIDSHRVNMVKLRALLKQLPPPGSSYTLRVTDHGRVVAEYVFKNGQLAAVRKFQRGKPAQVKASTP